MQPPVLLVVDADAVGIRTLERELVKRYATDYEVICLASAEEARARLEALAGGSTRVALVLAALSLGERESGELLASARRLHSHAKRALVISWGEWGGGCPVARRT